MGKHSIIVIKNNNKYLQYYDKSWDCFLFMNCKLDDVFSNNTIIDYVSKKLNIDKDEINCRLIGDKIHNKFSESAKKIKEYHHYFYEVIVNEKKLYKNDIFEINNVKYKWFSYDELENDKVIKKINGDIISFVREYNL